jgi:hypothetical protein
MLLNNLKKSKSCLLLLFVYPRNAAYVSISRRGETQTGTDDPLPQAV